MKKIGYPLSVALCVGLCACSNMQQTSPITDHSTTTGYAAVSSNTPIPSTTTAYTVQPHETLYQISRRSGHSVSDLARWNQLENPNDLKVGQVLRVQPPAGDSSVAQTYAISETPAPAPKPTPQPTPAPVKKTEPVVTTAPVVSGVPDVANIQWAWPVPGNVITSFGSGKNRGIDLAGTKGQPVKAAADGVVLHKGSMKGYGNLVIIRHATKVLTAYAHNSRVLVKEGQKVTRGQTIAEMGNSDADRVKLHFEIRYDGRPVDPVKYLPKR